MTSRQVSVGVGDAAREMWVASVSASFFGFFDAPPVLGRYFTSAEDSIPNGSPVAVLSYATWQMQYGGRRQARGPPGHLGPAPRTSHRLPPPRLPRTLPHPPPHPTPPHPP